MSYVWSTGAVTNQITQSPTQTTTYTVTITDASGCTNSANIIVPVFPLPVVAFAADSVCFGDFTTLTNSTGVTSGSISSYQWNYSSGGTSNQTNPTNQFPAGTSTVQLIATTDKGCVDSLSKPIRVWQLPVASLVADTTEGCPPINVNFTDLSTVADGTIQSWSWNSGNGTTSNQSTMNVDYPVSGFYNVSLQVTSSYGCVDDTLLNNYIHVYDQPVADFSTMPNQPSVYVPNVQFLDESFAAANWFWEFGDQGVSNIQNPYHTYTFPGTYTVTLYIESNEGCKDTISKEVTILDEVAVWIPNSFSPNGDGFNDLFYAFGSNISDFNLKIFNRWGQMVFATDDPTIGWDGRFEDQEASQDVYVYKADYKTIKKTTEVITGRLTLVR